MGQGVKYYSNQILGIYTNKFQVGNKIWIELKHNTIKNINKHNSQKKYIPVFIVINSNSNREVRIACDSLILPAVSFSHRQARAARGRGAEWARGATGRRPAASPPRRPLNKVRYGKPFLSPFALRAATIDPWYFAGASWEQNQLARSQQHVSIFITTHHTTKLNALTNIYSTVISSLI